MSEIGFRGAKAICAIRLRDFCNDGHDDCHERELEHGKVDALETHSAPHRLLLGIRYLIFAAVEDMISVSLGLLLGLLRSVIILRRW